MDISIILIGVGLIAIIGFLKQFGILSGKALGLAIVGAGLFLGFSIFQNYRRNRLQEEFKRREKELEEQEKALKEIEKEIELSDREVREAEAALDREKAVHKKAIAHIEAEKAKDIQKRRKEINELSVDELLEQF